MRVLYEYLAEASVVFSKVFPVIHSLLDAKINSVLTLCHDQVILCAVQNIIQNMIACEETSGEKQHQQQLHFLQTCGFGGLWRFAGPFSQSSLDNAELFVNCLEAMVETCLPGDDSEIASLNPPHLTTFVQSDLFDSIGGGNLAKQTSQPVLLKHMHLNQQVQMVQHSLQHNEQINHQSHALVSSPSPHHRHHQFQQQPLSPHHHQQLQQRSSLPPVLSPQLLDSESSSRQAVRQKSFKSKLKNSTKL